MVESTIKEDVKAMQWSIEEYTKEVTKKAQEEFVKEVCKRIGRDKRLTFTSEADKIKDIMREILNED